MTLSTRDLRELPSIASLRRLTRSLAMLDAILSPEWQYRYYSFNSAWADSEMMASMRNGSGDYWFALFCRAGVALHGLAHEAAAFRPGKPLAGIFDRLPPQFHENFLREPAFTTEDSTFCVWRLDDQDRWTWGTVDLPPGEDPDGSAGLLAILAGRPEQYVEFGSDYYERNIDLDAVTAVYRHQPLDAALIATLNPEAELDELAEDIAEIGYPEQDG
jgi:hypothetical protein